VRPIILASASPRRAALLRQIGVPFEVCPAHLDERRIPGEAPAAHVARLALAKAERVAITDRVTLGADTVVVSEGEIFGKPLDMDQGVAMLMALSGRTHQVVSGIAATNGHRQRVLHVITHVTFRPIPHEEAVAYWLTGEPQDKAGGYGIQGIGGIFAQSITGSYSAVVGLPLSETEQLLREFGVETWRARSNV
jgi:septum formation protein